MTDAASLIERSIIHTEIVSADWTSDLASGLAAECDDSTEASDTVIEFWGVDDDGCNWRVHLTGPRTDAQDDDWPDRADAPTVTDGQIRALRSEAAEAGDREQVTICDVAFGRPGGDRDDARAECARVIADAAAQGE